MINLIWLLIMCLGIGTAMATGKTAEIPLAIFINAKKAIEFTIGLAGIIAFWSGILKIAEVSGITNSIAKFFRPLLAKLFPKVPQNSPVLGLISLTLSANLLGLGNVTTPLGLQTMSELQKLNQTPNLASSEICTFLALVFGGLSIIPSTLLAIRLQAGSPNPGLIMFPTLVITFSGTLTCLLINYLFQKFFKYHPDRGPH